MSGAASRVRRGLLVAAANVHELASNVPWYRVLRQIPPFSFLGEDRLAGLRDVVRLRHRRRAAIIPIGAAAGGVHVLLSGHAAKLIEDAHGRTITLAPIARNEVFGDFAPDCDEAPWIGVSAISACETLFVPGASFRACVAGHYEASIVMHRLTAGQLRAAQLKVATLGLLSVHERVARVLAASAESIDGRWVVGTGAEDIARAVAASREMVSRVVKCMQARGLVRRERRRLIVLDWTALNAAGGFLHAAAPRQQIKSRSATG